MNQYILTVKCPDGSGLVAAIAGLIAERKANLLHLNQHTASDINTFMLKALFETSECFNTTSFKHSFETLAQKFQMNWQLCNVGRKERIAILVSETNHCLWELLLKHKDGELDCDIAAVISNHPVNEHVTESFGIPFFSVDYSKDKEAAEARMQNILTENRTDTIVMARFMQILSSGFTEFWREKIINIHHGFLPAFKGARPYHQAWYKGVKIIGATAHFADEHLDQGPIIAQEVVDVKDTCSIDDLIKIGKDVERRTLVHALSLYLRHSIFVAGNRTFILD